MLQVSRNISLVMALLLGLSGCSNDDADQKPREGFDGAIYEEGIHFEEIEKKVPVINSDVAVFFWFQCPHCNNIREPIANWVEQNPEFSVEKIHSMISKSWAKDQMLYQALKKRGIFDRSYGVLFDHIHGGEDAKKGIDEILSDAGIDIDNKTFSFSDEEKAEMMANVKQIIEAEKDIGAMGVPYLVVKGKYLIRNRAFSSYDEMMHAVGWVLRNK